jgi:hypothetical protein
MRLRWRYLPENIVQSDCRELQGEGEGTGKPQPKHGSGEAVIERPQCRTDSDIRDDQSPDLARDRVERKREETNESKCRRSFAVRCSDG